MEELDLKELFELFVSKWIQILLIIIIFAGIGVVYTMGFVKPKYSANTTLVLTTSSKEGDKTITTNDVTLNSKLVSTYSEIVKSDAVLNSVTTNLGTKISAKALKNAISVNAVKDADIISIIVTTEDADESAKIANELAKVFCEKIKELYKINNINILDEARPNYTPANINHTKDVIIFAFIGVAVAVGYVLLANMLDTTIKSTEEIEKELKIPVLVTIPYIYSLDNSKKGGKRR